MPVTLTRLLIFLNTSAFAALATAPAFAAGLPSEPFSLKIGGSDVIEASALKRLPAGADELTFRGENGSRSFSVYLTAAEAARIRTFQIAALGSVVTLPERSSLRLSINGRSVATLPIGANDKAGHAIVQIPLGLLSAGYNQVRMDVALSHRVDCSIAATYELWARVDPAETGFVGSSNPQEIRKLRDLIGEPLAEDGATHIHVRMGQDATPDAVARNAEFLQYVVRRAQTPRPVVDVGEEAGVGAGFDLLLSRDGEVPTDEPLRIVGQDGDAIFLRNLETRRLTVMFSGGGDVEIGDQLDAVVNTERADETSAANEGAFTFDRLGFSTGPFQGRHYLSSASVDLPGDFFSANYDNVQLLLDAAHSDSLDAESALLVRVNGTLVASLPLQPGRGEVFNHRQIGLPLHSFQPGHNEVTIEGLLSTPEDRRCDVANPSHDTRLEIAPTSELRFPHLAHMETFPRLASAIYSRFGEEPRLPIYVPNADLGTLGFAFTALANLGDGSASGPRPEFHPYAPNPSDPPGLLAARFGELPPAFAAAMRRLAVMSDPATTEADSSLPLARSLALAKPSGPAAWKTYSLARLQNFIGAEAGSAAIPLPQSFLLFGAVASSAAKTQSGLPHFAPSGSQWIVMASSDAGVEREGLQRFTANGGWSRLSGQVSAYDAATGELKSAEPTETAYVTPRRFVAADLRPILGGVLSDSAGLSLGAIGAVILLLGALTHVLVRRSGVR